MGTAFFDMDLTLLSRVSVSMYVRQAWRKRELGFNDILFTFWGSVLYRLGRVDIQHVYERGLAFLKQKRESEMRAEGIELFETALKPLVYEQGRELVQEHQRRGDRVVVLSSSVPYLIDPVCRHLGIEERICTELEVRDDRFTGRFVGQLCFAGDKVQRVRAYAAEHGLDMEETHFYSDSITDLPMFLAVRHPVVVNPDRLLRRYALHRGWRILYFSHAASWRAAVGMR